MGILDKKIQDEYKNRINRVFIYIDENLDTDLSLNKLSSVALYSPYHFHRVFKFITKETLNDYVVRRRIEKAALDLIHRVDEISKISIKYGFNDNSSFTRAFKKYYQKSPSEFRRQNSNKISKIRQLDSKNSQVIQDYEKYICNINNLKNWIEMNAKIEVKETPELTLAAVTHIGIHNVEIAFNKLIKWANGKNLLAKQNAKIGRLFHDSIKVTAPDKVRMNIFLTVSEPYEVDGEIFKSTIEKGRCIVGHFEISPMEFERSWTGLFVWMNENGYTKSDRNPFEIYHNDYRTHPENKFIVDLCIPVE